ncbi:copper-binding protein [Paucibacter sp. PLA-PC-4]|uniref:copper-binding protein n=1 Tax=Paucibacter sp. PLA-PC-4 TaxID=2993655 RepID=UPI002249116C|nr:copper-binding protein [Paucibacter sp. PLA-PC-4]MCX2861455.1 copper-binding protein [Paucibacter sp. PLA-PC-4]
MKLSHQLLIGLLAGASLQLCQAQTPTRQHATALAADLAWAEGEVRRIDLGKKKMTLKHGEIKNLDMPPMTMVFTWEDGALPADLLTALKPGDKLRFQARMVDGKILLVALQP